MVSSLTICSKINLFPPIVVIVGVKTLFKMGLILIKISLQEKSYSNLKKRFPTMCETLEALRNPPLHLLEEEKVIKKVFLHFACTKLLLSFLFLFYFCH